MSGSKPPNFKPLKQQAAYLDTQGKQAVSNYYTGTLQPGQQASYDLAKQGNTTAVKNAYSALGIGSGSTMEAQDLGTANTKAEAFKQSMLDSYMTYAQSFLSGASTDLTSILGTQAQEYQSDMQTWGAAIGGVFGALGQAVGAPAGAPGA